MVWSLLSIFRSPFTSLNLSPPTTAPAWPLAAADRKSTRLNSSHDQISYAVFCLKKKKKNEPRDRNRTRLHYRHEKISQSRFTCPKETSRTQARTSHELPGSPLVQAPPTVHTEPHIS